MAHPQSSEEGGEIHETGRPSSEQLRVATVRGRLAQLQEALADAGKDPKFSTADLQSALHLHAEAKLKAEAHALDDAETHIGQAENLLARVIESKKQTRNSPPASRKWRVAIAVLVVFLALAAGALITWYCISSDRRNRPAAQPEAALKNEVSSKDGIKPAPLTPNTSGPAAVPAKELSSEEVYEKCKQSVVVIEATDPGIGQVIRTGSGFVVKLGSHVSVIATNAHVIKGCTSLTVRVINGRSGNVTTSLYIDREADVAILPVPNELRNTPPLRIEHRLPKVGATVYAIGAPRGLDFTFTRGVVSQIRKMDNEQEFIQTDVSISPGSSGGPLLSTRGNVVGMTTLASRAALDANNLNFAVSSASVWVAAFESHENQTPVNLATAAGKDVCDDGWAKYKKGDYDGAIGCFNAAIRLSPDCMSAYKGRGQAWFIKAELQPSSPFRLAWLRVTVADFTRVLDSDSKDTYALSGRGEALGELEDFSSALRDLDELVRLEPDDQSYGRRARVKDKKGDAAGALRDYDTVVRLQPIAPNLNNRGLFKLNHSDPDGAIADFDEAIRQWPDVNSLYQFRGKAKLAKGDRRGAETDFATARRLGWKGP